MKLNWRGIVTAFICVLVIGLSLLYYPLCKIPVFYEKSEIGNVELFGTGEITETKVLEQEFTAPYDLLQSISIYLQYVSEERTGDLYFTLYDKNKEMLFSKEYPMNQIPNYEWWEIEIGEPLKRGETYSYLISARGYGEKPPQLFAATKEDAPKESGIYRYNGEEVDAALGLNYKYFKFAESPRQVFPFWGLFLLLGAICIEIVWHIDLGKGKK